ncbi:protein of unknown function [Methanoculleus bourgensis]|uniref:Uncharacterized protein n=1 Tax=Methanoculleus bourgensis TaxID=83986 RepID=A0A0X3BPQ4_9EURY|nr:protein of unknown function [Methanoculleus bourgensis]
MAVGRIMALFVPRAWLVRGGGEPPQGDSHHGPQHGVRAWGMGCFPAYSRSLCPMNAQHPFAIIRAIRTRTHKIR